MKRKRGVVLTGTQRVLVKSEEKWVAGVGMVGWEKRRWWALEGFS